MIIEHANSFSSKNNNENINKSTVLLYKNSLTIIMKITKFLCYNNAYMSIVSQILVNEKSKTSDLIWTCIIFFHYIISMYKEYFIHYKKISFGGIINLLGISTLFSISYFIYRTAFLYWLPILYIKHYTNLIFVSNRTLRYINELITYLCVLLFLFQYNKLFLCLTTGSSFLYNKNKTIGIFYVIIICGSWLNLYIDNIFVRFCVTLLEAKIILINIYFCHKFSKNLNLIIKKPIYDFINRIDND